MKDKSMKTKAFLIKTTAAIFLPVAVLAVMPNEAQANGCPAGTDWWNGSCVSNPTTPSNPITNDNTNTATGVGIGTGVGVGTGIGHGGAGGQGGAGGVGNGGEGGSATSTATGGNSSVRSTTCRRGA